VKNTAHPQRDRYSQIQNLAVNKAAVRAQLDVAPDVRVVTTIGPFKPQKNLGDFLQVGPIVASRYPSCCFLIAVMVTAAFIEDQIRLHGLEHKVKLLGGERIPATYWPYRISLS